MGHRIRALGGALTSFALGVGLTVGFFGFRSGQPEGIDQARYVEIDLGSELSGLSSTSFYEEEIGDGLGESVKPLEYTPPAGFLRERYLRYQLEAAQLDDTDLLLAYSHRIAQIEIISERTREPIPLEVAKSFGDYAHAVWAEMELRGLPSPGEGNEFPQLWSRLEIQ